MAEATQPSIASHVYDTSAGIGMIFNNLQAKTRKKMIQCGMEKVNNKIDSMDADWKNKYADLLQRISSWTGGSTGVTTKQVEKYLETLMKSEKFAKLFGSACFTLNGKIVTVNGFLKKLALAPKKISEEVRPSDDGEDVLGLTWKLTGGYTATFDLGDEIRTTPEGQLENGMVKYYRKLSTTNFPNGEGGSWSGSYKFGYGRRETLAGQCLSEEIPLYEENLVFEFNDLEPCPFADMPDGVDLDDDGVVGPIPTPTPEPIPEPEQPPVIEPMPEPVAPPVEEVAPIPAIEPEQPSVTEPEPPISETPVEEPVLVPPADESTPVEEPTPEPDAPIAEPTPAPEVTPEVNPNDPTTVVNPETVPNPEPEPAPVSVEPEVNPNDPTVVITEPPVEPAPEAPVSEPAPEPVPEVPAEEPVPEASITPDEPTINP